MLILTRRPGQIILLDDDIKIMITNVRGNTVSIGIDAPQEMKIWREEVYNRIKGEEAYGSTQSAMYASIGNAIL